MSSQRRIGYYTGQYEARLEQLDRTAHTESLALEDFGFSDTMQTEITEAI